MRCTWVLFFLFTITTSVLGDFYQYTDDKGVTVFTDDISEIPGDQRIVAKKFKSSSEENASPKVTKKKKQRAGIRETKEKTTQTDVSLEWLNKEKNELDNVYQDLIQRRDALKKEEKTVLPGDASAALKKKADLLNQDIIAFDLRRKAFDIKVEAFNGKNAQ